MPLPLTDPRWNELRSSYGSTEDTVDWLAEALENGGFSHERLSDLVNEMQHQGGTCTAMYAVAPYLIEFAKNASQDDALDLLIHAGLIYANSTRPKATPCPEFLLEEFAVSASVGAKLLAPLLPLTPNFDSYKWAAASLAGFLGHHSFARFLDGLDLYQGKFHHVLLDEPFPPEA